MRVFLFMYGSIFPKRLEMSAWTGISMATDGGFIAMDVELFSDEEAMMPWNN